METQDVKILFQGRDEILRILDANQEIVKFLGFPNESCPLIGASIQPSERLGKGGYGAVFVISFPGMGAKEYAIKRVKLNVNWDKQRKVQHPDWIPIFQQHGWSNKYIPSECIIQAALIVKARPVLGNKEIIIPANSYVCNNDAYVEYVIGVYAGQLYRRGTCVHFFNIYSFITCPEGDNTFNQYMLMDRLDGDLRTTGCTSLSTLRKYSEYVREDIYSSLYVQVLVAIATYQQSFQISHNDLHTGNVFIECITTQTHFNNQPLQGMEWFHYEIHGKHIYLPATPGIVKIGDYGRSTKYSHPMVVNLDVLDDFTIPNHYVPSYDSFLFTYNYIHSILKSDTTPFINECVNYMCGVDIGLGDEIWYFTHKGYINQLTARPTLEKLPNIKSALNVLLGPVLQNYGAAPSSTKIALLGTL